MTKFIPPPLCLFLCLGSWSLATQPDSEYSIRRVVKLVPKGSSGYELTIEERIQKTFLSGRSLKASEYQVAEEYLGPITGISATMAGTSLQIDVRRPGLEDVFFSDFKVHCIQLPPKYEAKSNLFINVKKFYADLGYLPFETIPNVDFLKSLVMEFHYPKGIDLEFETISPRGEIPVKIDREPGKTTLSISNLAHVKSIPYFPFNDLHAFIVPRFIDGDGPLDKTTPETFSAWYMAKLTRFDQVDSATYQELKQRLVNCEGSLDKLCTINDFIQEKIRYMASYSGEGSIFPRAANDILSSTYGDCKDRVLLFRELARLEGLNVNPVLISTTPMPDFEFIRINMFDHAMCSYEEDGLRHFFDPTDSYHFGEHLSSDFYGKRVLVLGDAPSWARIPKPQDQDPQLDITADLDLDHPEDVQVIVTLRGDYRAAALRALKELSAVDMENLLSNLVNAHFRKISIDYFQPVEDNHGQFVAKGDFSSYIVPSTRKRYLPGLPFRFGDKSLNKRTGDSWEIFDSAFHVRLKLRIQHAGFTFEGLSKSLPDFGDYLVVSTAEKSADETHLEFHMDTKGRYGSGAEKTDFIQFNNQFIQSKNVYFVFRSMDP